MKGHTPRKRFGQNFLVSPGVIRDIVAAIAPQRGDNLVEIDRDLIARLRKTFPAGRLEIHEGDALAFDFASLGANLRIVGNLPYNISTPLLFHLATYADRVRDMHFMLQKEVVDRMVAAPGGSDNGRLSVMLQYRFEMERLFVVPPDAFDPPPKVDSAIVRLVPRPASQLTARDEAVLARVVTAAFSQRRKMLRNTLREFFDEAGLAALGIAPTARPEELGVADYVTLANALAG